MDLIGRRPSPDTGTTCSLFGLSLMGLAGSWDRASDNGERPSLGMAERISTSCFEAAKMAASYFSVLTQYGKVRRSPDRFSQNINPWLHDGSLQLLPRGCRFYRPSGLVEFFGRSQFCAIRAKLLFSTNAVNALILASFRQNCAEL